MKTEKIFLQWASTFQNINKAQLVSVFRRVVSHYVAENRYYHNLGHVHDLFEQIIAANMTEDSRRVLLNAALFHDVIYHPQHFTNEKQSAEYAQKELSALHVPRNIIDEIYKIILATAFHRTEDGLTQLFLDMDLSILGTPVKVYQSYRMNLRQEYRCFPDEIYQIGRKQFLQKMLSRQSIFLTNRYQKKYEEQARTNINLELQSL